MKIKELVTNFKWQNKYWYWAGGGVLGIYAITYFARQSKLVAKTCFKPAGFVPSKLTPTEADINIKLKMKNSSAVDYYLKNQIYNVYINDNFVGVIRNPNKIYIAPERSSDVWLNLKFNPIQVLNLSWQTLKDLLVKNTDAKIQLKGSARITTLIILLIVCLR